MASSHQVKMSALGFGRPLTSRANWMSAHPCGRLFAAL
jgi:hypothetical protein